MTRNRNGPPERAATVAATSPPGDREAPDSVRQDAGPVPLRQAVADLLGRSRERDSSLRMRLAAWREGWRAGFLAGLDRGRRHAEAEQERAWRSIAGPVAAGGLSHAELERRRWGPGGREHFADPRPGDYPGRGNPG